MRVDEVMLRDVAPILPDQSVADAARLMGDLDTGALPVGWPGGGVVGIVTERDILLRLVARGLAPATTVVAAVMSSDVVCCRPDDRAEDIARAMIARQIRRMPVVDGDGRLLGVVSLADIAERMSPAGPEAGRR